MPKAIAFIVLLGLSVACLAQADEAARIKPGECSVYCALSSLIKSAKYNKPLTWNSRHQAYFVMFSIDATGHVKNLGCNIYNDTTVVQYVTEAIQSTSGKWIPATHNGIPVESIPFLLPITFEVGGLPYTHDTDNFNGSISHIVNFGAQTNVGVGPFNILRPFNYILYR